MPARTPLIVRSTRTSLFGAPGTAISVAPSSGTLVQPSSRAECAGKSAVRSGVAVKIALTIESLVSALASISARSRREVASRIALARFALTEIAPRTAAMVVGRAVRGRDLAMFATVPTL